MLSNDPSPIAGLDPAALFGLSADEPGAVGLWQPPTLEEAAKFFPNWKVLGLLGRGGMGAVYHVRQPDLDREVAVKLLPIEASRDERQVERFRREARTLAKLKHPGIVALHEAGMTPAGHFFFVMEYIEGHPLSDLIAQGKMNAPRAIDIVRQVCDALAYAHGQGVVHRDIKPSNILIDALGQAKVADFGLAHWDKAETEGALSLSRTGMFMGTPAYTAPEQARDATKVDHRADIYSLGVLLYELLTGELPRGVFQPPSRKAGTDAHLDSVVQRALQERPEDRYQAASELKNDVSSVSSKPKPRNTTVMVFAVAAVVLLAMIGLGAWFMWWMAGPSAPKMTQSIAKPVPSSPATKRNETKPEVEKASRSNTGTSSSLVAPPRSPVTTASPQHLPTGNPQVAKVNQPIVTTPSPMPATPSPAGIAVPVATTSTPTAKVWSINPLSPALSPPDELMKMAWKDCVLTTEGGAVIMKDGMTLFTWHSAQPGKAQRRALKTRAASLASTGDDVLLLDEEDALSLWRLERPTDGHQVSERVRRVFSSNVSAFGWLDTDGTSHFWPIGAIPSPQKLPFNHAMELAVSSITKVYALDADDELMRLELLGKPVLLDKPPSLRKLVPWNGGLLGIDHKGSLIVLDGPSPELPLLSGINEVIVGIDFAIARDANNKLTIWGKMVPDSPQRLRMPEGTTHLTASPLGLIAAW